MRMSNVVWLDIQMNVDFNMARHSKVECRAARHSNFECRMFSKLHAAKIRMNIFLQVDY